jgi:hypothetical protein
MRKKPTEVALDKPFPVKDAMTADDAMTAGFDPFATHSRHIRENVFRRLRNLAEAKSAELTARLGTLAHTDAAWCVSRPMNAISGIEAVEAQVYGPLRQAIPDLERGGSVCLNSPGQFY